MKLGWKKIKKIENLPSKNPFDITDYVEMQKQENNIDLVFFELAEQNKIKYNQTPVNTLLEAMGKLKNGFSRMVF